jgi:superfamily II DNA or RNA helicase
MKWRPFLAVAPLRKKPTTNLQPKQPKHMIQLRPYQLEAVEKTRQMILAGKKRFVFCSPTGSGKTFTFSFIVKSALEKGKRVLILTHRIELLTQAGGSLNELGINPVKIEAGKKIGYFSSQIYTAMIETISRRMEKLEYINFVQSLDLIIIDEAHFGNFDKFFSQIDKKTVVIGFTATPHREKNQKSLDEFYEGLVEVISIPDLIQKGFLANPVSYGVKLDFSSVAMKGNDYDSDSLGSFMTASKVYEGVIENYKKICPGTKAIAFCPNIKSSVKLRDELTEAGLNARHLDAGFSKKEREQTLIWFKNTPDAIICNVGILTTGFDEPTIKTIILYRATKSLPLFLQMVGRGSRVIPGQKDSFTILDFGNNINEHDFWEAERQWSLKKKKKKQSAAPVKECKDCGALLPASVMLCHHCGYEFPKSEKQKVKSEIAFLQLLSKKEVMKRATKSSVEQKAEMAKAKLISPYWVLHQLKDRNEALEFVKLMGYKKGWVFMNKDRFKVLQDGN